MTCARIIATWAVLVFVPPGAYAGPPSVVSLDYCADQYVLALADREQIAALSPDADKDFSALRDRAEGLPQVRALAEDVLALHPDLIVRSYGGGPRALTFYERAGLETAQIGYAADFDDVRDNIRAVAAALERPERGEALIARMDETLAAAGARGGAQARAVYLTASGATTGSSTMMNAVLEAAGFENALAGEHAGWGMLGLEALILDPPEIVVTGFFDTDATRLDRWSLTRHSALRGLLEQIDAVHLDGAEIGCASWLMAEASLDARNQADAIAAERTQ